MALAGGASITCPPRSGYLYAGRRDAVAGRPHAHLRCRRQRHGVQRRRRGGAAQAPVGCACATAIRSTRVIRGGAVNNDGGGKASFTAPSSDGQAAVITHGACRMPGSTRAAISYVEAHGTATPLGDPIEIEGLTQAFRRDTDDTGFCAIGSVKSNVGHLVIAAGAAGVIKTALALAEARIPASLHYRAPNPEIDFAALAVRGQRHAQRVASDRRRAARAGVSSFGVGGTNAHVVLEEAPPRAAVGIRRRAAAAGAVGPHAHRAAGGCPASRGRICTRSRRRTSPTWHGRSRSAARPSPTALPWWQTTRPSRSRSWRVTSRPRRPARSLPAHGQRCRLHVPRPGCALRRHGARAVCMRAGVPRGLRCLRGGARRRRWTSTCARWCSPTMPRRCCRRR